MRAIFLDTETGGLDPRVHALTHVAAIAFEVDAQGAWVIDEISLPIVPREGLEITQKALEIQGATLEGLNSAGRCSEPEALLHFSNWIQGVGRLRLPFFSHNAPFDRGFFTEWVRRCPELTLNGYQMPPDYLIGHRAPWVCTINLANALIAAGCMDKPEKGLSLDSLAAHLGVQGRSGTAHNALEDCQVGVRVAGALWRRAGWV